MEKNDKHWYLPYLIIIIAFFIFYFPLFLPNTALIMGDYLDQNCPNRIYATKCIREGYLPMWTDGVFAGYPFLSDPQTAVFYPPNLVMSLLITDPGSSAVMDTYVFLHCMFLALGAVFLCRGFGLGKFASIISAMILTFNGYNTVHFGHIVIINAIAHGYWAIGCVLRAHKSENIKWSLLSGLFLSMAILVGHTQTVYYIFCAICFGGAAIIIRNFIQDRMYLKLRAAGNLKQKIQIIMPLIKIGFLFMLPVLIGVLGSFIQILPTQGLVKLSVRKSLSLGEASFLSMPVKYIPSIVFPNLYSTIIWRIPEIDRYMVFSNRWGHAGMEERIFHIGLIAFTLVILGWRINKKSFRAMFLFWSSLLLWIVSFGESGFLFTFLYDYFPGYKHFRIPTRIMLLVFLAWGLLAGMGIDAILKNNSSEKIKKAVKSSIIILVILALISSASLFIAHAMKNDWAKTFELLFAHSDIIKFTDKWTSADFVMDVFHQINTGIIIFVAAISVLVVLLKQKKNKNITVAFIVILVFAELLIYGYHRNISSGYEGFTDLRDLNFRAPAKKPEGRILLQEYPANFIRNSASYMDLSYAGGYNPIRIRNADRFMPCEVFCFGNCYEENIRDLWNVSDLIFPIRENSLNINGREAKLMSSGNYILNSADKLYPEKLEIKNSSNLPVKAFHIIMQDKFFYEYQENKEMLEIEAFDSSNSLLSAANIIAGKITENNNPEKNIYFQPAASKPEAQFFTASMAFNTSQIPDKIILNEKAGWAFGFSHIILEYESGLKIINTYELENHERAPTTIHYLGVLNRKSAPGYAWIAPKANLVSNKLYTKDMKKILSEGRIDFKKEIFLNDKHLEKISIKDFNAPENSMFRGTAEYKSILPHKKIINTDSNENGWLVIAITNYPGWKAKIDGKPAEIYLANGFQMAIPLSKGKHTINLDYKTPDFLIGAVISIFTWFTSLLFLILPISTYCGKKQKL